MAFYFEEWFIKSIYDNQIILKDGTKYINKTIKHGDRVYPLCNQFLNNEFLIEDNRVIRGYELIHIPKKLEIKKGEVIDDLRDTKQSS